MEKIKLKQLDQVLEYLYTLDDDKQETDDIEKHCGIDKKTSRNIYQKLEVDGYLKIVGDTYDNGIIVVYLEPKGRGFIGTSSYRNEYKKDWVKRNWVLADIIKISIGLIIGFVFRIATEPKNIQQQPQKQSSQQLPQSH